MRNATSKKLSAYAAALAGTAVVVTIIACGGGGGKDDNSPTPAPIPVPAASAIAGKRCATVGEDAVDPHGVKLVCDKSTADRYPKWYPKPPQFQN